jgi:hypothetical protein
MAGGVIEVANGVRSHSKNESELYGAVHYRTKYMNFFKVLREKDRKGINKAKKEEKKI